MFTEKSPKSQQDFYCEKCDYKSCKKSDYDKHILTRKHLNVDQCLPKSRKKYICSCEKEYSCKQSLYTHKQKCTSIISNNTVEATNSSDNDIKMLTTLVLEVVKSNNEFQKQNSEFQKHMFEIYKNGITNNINNNITHTNSHNKSFNLQFFLNETCKDAMNLSDFIDSVKIQLSDLESVGKLGFVDGISNIIIKNLEALEVEKRPIHCCDAKRETMYIKDQNKWEKEDNELKRMKDLVRHVRDKNISMINTWRDLYPECVKSDSKKTTQFNQIYMESFGGETGKEKGSKQEKEEKIISKIAKSVIIDKYE
jgi:hypothetical protein